MVVVLPLACLLSCLGSALFAAFEDFFFHGLEFIEVDLVVGDLFSLLLLKWLSLVCLCMDLPLINYALRLPVFLLLFSAV